MKGILQQDMRRQRYLQLLSIRWEVPSPGPWLLILILESFQLGSRSCNARTKGAASARALHRGIRGRAATRHEHAPAPRAKTCRHHRILGKRHTVSRKQRQ